MVLHLIILCVSSDPVSGQLSQRSIKHLLELAHGGQLASFISAFIYGVLAAMSTNGLSHVEAKELRIGVVGLGRMVG